MSTGQPGCRRKYKEGVGELGVEWVGWGQMDVGVKLELGVRAV